MKKIILILLIFLIVCGIIILNNGHYELKDKSELFRFLKDCGSWIMSLGENLGNITSYAVKKNWMPH